MAQSNLDRDATSAGPGSLLNEVVVKLNGARNVVLKAPGLRIIGGSGDPGAEAENAIFALVQGTIVTAAATEEMPALSGTVDADEFGIYLWTLDAAGTITQATLATGATLADITLPAIPDDQAVLGFVLVNPTGTGDFVGGTDDLDDETVVPNAVFFDGSAFGGALGDLIGYTGASPSLPA